MPGFAPTLGQGFQNVGLGINAAAGLASGTPTGYAGAGLSAAKLAANYTGNSNLGNAANAGLAGLSIYSGLKQGGVAGDTQAAVGMGQLGLQGASAAGAISGAAANAGESALGYVAAPLALYNFGKNWQSGSTGSDALSGAEAGAAIGSVIPVVGTILGGVIGGAVGAISSAFGGGRQDPESEDVDSIDAAAPNGMAGANPQQSFTYLAGVMDAKNNTPGHSAPIEQVFGRMGEGNLLNQMAAQINSAYSKGEISSGEDPEEVYSNVISPWLSSKGAGIAANSTDVKGNNFGTNLIDSMENLIGSYMHGSLTDTTAIGSSGQVDSSLPAFVGAAPQATPVSTRTGWMPAGGLF